MNDTTYIPSENDLKFKSFSPALCCQLLHPQAKLPTRGTEGSAGLDLYAADRIYGNNTGIVGYDTGIAVEIPHGYVGLVFPRSSIKETGIRLSNSCGVIDSDYRGTIKAFFDRERYDSRKYEVGDRIGQLVIVPYLHLTPVSVDSLPDTERGSGGFGSTDDRNFKTLTPEDGRAFKDGCDQLSEARKANEELKSYTQAVTE